MSRHLPIALLATLTTLCLATPALADSKPSTPKMSAGIVAGYNFDAEAPLLGLDARLMVYEMESVAFSINPRFDYYFVSSSTFLGLTTRTTLLQVEVNALAHIVLSAPLTPFAGIGGAMLYQRATVSDRNGNHASRDARTFPGFNLIAGTTFDLSGPLTPFAQFRLTFGDTRNAASLMVGATFAL